MVSLQWRHNERDGVSNHRRFDCLLNRLLIFKFVTFVFAYKQLHLCWVYFIYGLTRAIGLSFTLLLLRMMFYGSMFFFKYCYDTRYQLKGVCSNHKICVHVLVITSSLVLCSSDHVTSAHHMITSSNGNIFRVTGPLCGEVTGLRWIPPQRPATQSSNAFFDLRLNKRLKKQSRCRWFETPSHSSWRHCNEFTRNSCSWNAIQKSY